MSLNDELYGTEFLKPLEEAVLKLIGAEKSMSHAQYSNKNEDVQKAAVAVNKAFENYRVVFNDTATKIGKMRQ